MESQPMSIWLIQMQVYGLSKRQKQKTYQTDGLPLFRLKLICHCLREKEEERALTKMRGIHRVSDVWLNKSLGI